MFKILFLYTIFQCFSLAFSVSAIGQTVPILPGIQGADMHYPISDSLKKDSLFKAQLPNASLARGTSDTLLVDTTRTDTTKKVYKGPQTSVKYTAEDSIVFDATRQTMMLYGDSKIDYGTMNLKAEQIDINWRQNAVDARGVPDSTGKLKGIPLFKEGTDDYQSKRILYNFKTKRGIIREVVTKQGDGYIHGEKVKKDEENNMFATHAKYTTCNLSHPHFYISSTKIKMIPNRKIITGPFNMVIQDVPTPLGFLFGIFPTPKTRSSGIIIPQYGESQNRGFFLTGGGFYWATNPYMGMRFLTDVYSLGGLGLQQLTEYRKKYAFDGNFSLRYNWVKIENVIEPARSINQHTFWLAWSHMPRTKGTGRFTANVNAGTSNYNQLNTTNPTTYLAPSFQSNVSYSKTFRGTPLSLNVTLRQDQNVNGIKNFTLPDVNFAVNRLMPFQYMDGSKSLDPIKKLNLAYNMTATNRITNDSNLVGSKRINTPILGTDPVQFTSSRGFYSYSDDYSYLLSRMQNGMRHAIPISTTLKVLKFLSVNPSFNYEEYWYLKSLTYRYKTDSSGNRSVDNFGNYSILRDTVNGFSRGFSYSTGASVTTRIYGTFFIRKGRVEAMRHTVIPNLSFNYRPDFAEPRWGNYQNLELNNRGQTANFSKFQGFVVGGPQGGKSAVIGFGLNNTFELKVKEKADSAKKFKKINLLDNVSLNGGYNILADSFNLSNISFSARTRLLNMFDINFGAQIDPYAYRLTTVPIATGTLQQYKRTPLYAISQGQGLGSMNTANLNFSTNLNPKAFASKSPKAKDEKKASDIKPIGMEEQQLQDIRNNPNAYLDFKIPWSLNISYNLNYSKSRIVNRLDRYDHSITANGDLSITQKWKIQVFTGYNLSQKSLVYPRLALTRDLHCWVMSFSWIPTGFQQSYSVVINVKSSVLQDLRLTRNRLWFDQ